MKKEAIVNVKKAAKIAGVTCVAAGAVALVTSGTALKAITEGGKYLADTVKKIVNEETSSEPVSEEIAAEAEIVTEEPAAEEVFAVEETV